MEDQFTTEFNIPVVQRLNLFREFDLRQMINGRPTKMHAQRASANDQFQSTVVQQLWPIFKFLRLCGNLPIVDEQDDTSHGLLRFSVRLFSRATAYTALVGGTYLCAWIFFFLNLMIGASWIAEIFKPIRTGNPKWSELGETVVKAMIILHPMPMILEIPSVWYGTPKLAPYLNNWARLEAEFFNVFPTCHFQFNLVRFRNAMAIFYVLIPSVIFVVLHYDDKFVPNGDAALNFAILLFYSFSLLGVSLAEDAKVILMYKTMQLSFKWLRVGIADQYCTCVDAKFPLRQKMVKDWLRILNLVRVQHDLMCKYQLYHQFFNTACSLFLYTSHLFVLFGSMRADAGYEMTWACLMLCTLLFGRLLFKATMAQTITDEEQAIATMLAQMDTQDVETRLELKFILDLIAIKPSEVTFGNYFTYNKRFLMGIVAQSVTYLIVLMQFNASTSPAGTKP